MHIAHGANVTAVSLTQYETVCLPELPYAHTRQLRWPHFVLVAVEIWQKWQRRDYLDPSDSVLCCMNVPTLDFDADRSTGGQDGGFFYTDAGAGDPIVG